MGRALFLVPTLWGRGRVGPPFLGARSHRMDLQGQPVGRVPTGSEGDAR
jgi:hypothetical protein